MGWLYSILLFAVVLFTGYVKNLSEQPLLTAEQEEAEATAVNMLAYANYARSYLQSNPSANGVIADSSLSLPSWYTKNSQISNVASAGYVFVYCACTDITEAVSEQLYEKTEGSYFVGTKTTGLFKSSNSSFSIAAPNTIPDGSAIYLVH